MLKWTGRYFFIAKEEELKDLTCELAWYMSGVGIITSIVTRRDGRITLNVLKDENCKEEYFVNQMAALATKHNVVGFQDWNEWKGE